MPFTYSEKVQENTAKIVALLEDGKNIAEVMQIMGCSYGTVRDIRKAFGLTTFLNRNRLFKALNYLISTELKLKDIAGLIGCTQACISFVYTGAKQAGIIMPERKRGRRKGWQNE